MVLHIYSSVTRVFFSCVFALSVGEAIKLCKCSNKHVLIVHNVPILCKPACVNAGTVCLYICLIACTNKLS